MFNTKYTVKTDTVYENDNLINMPVSIKDSSVNIALVLENRIKPKVDLAFTMCDEAHEAEVPNIAEIKKLDRYALQVALEYDRLIDKALEYLTIGI